ncbi:Flp family type IVb pilin [Blastopirellula marina]|uniref:Branched-chain amino acid aminotransferase n=1 Tax=Blastopirellula marina TaxID=124 RepID=A0A2S8GDI9_9BACT|nr:hypothetical protein [Blastopirellula marina]PQO42154.1 hypothetical protein C5Y93_27805 [Blastopirellula marina]
MLNLLKQLWNDERGFVNSAELILIATLAVIGMIVGLAAMRDSFTQEMADTGAAVGEVNQSYSVLVNSNGVGDPTTAPQITSTGANGTVTVNRDFQQNGSTIVSVSSTFRNFQYEDQSDVGDGQDTPNMSPPAIVTIDSNLIEEGEALP